MFHINKLIMTYFTEVLIEILSIIDKDDLMQRIESNNIHVGMYLYNSPFAEGDEHVRLTNSQLEHLIEEVV